MKTENRDNRTILALTLALVATVALQSSAATHYVSQTSPSPAPPYSTPQTAAHNIQDAVDVAIDGDTVLVAPGDYDVTDQITVTRGVRLQSTAGASQTFLTGEGSWCLAISNALATADGFTLRRGPAGYAGGAVLVGGTIQNCNFTNFYNGPSGAIWMSGGTVSNVVVQYLREPSPDSAAVYCSDSGLVTDSQILGIPGINRNGGAIILVNSHLQNSVISGLLNASRVSGAAVSAFSSTVVGCLIRNNYNLGQGGGARLQDSLMDRCIVTGNTAGTVGLGTGGGGIFETNSIISDSLIVSNRVVIGDPGTTHGGLGGGVYMQGGALLDCTVSGNARAPSGFPGGGGGVFAESGGITNCIIYFNSGDPGSPSTNWYNVGPATFDHCCTVPDPGGTGNITQDPQFADLASGNYHLASSSPCIGAGVVQPWMIGAQDLDGNSRTTGGRVDIGAYERPAATPQELVQGLIAEVNRLIAAGTLPHRHGNALLLILRAALNSINRGHGQAACGLTGAFIKIVQAFTSHGQLNGADGQALISAANNLRAALGCGRSMNPEEATEVGAGLANGDFQPLMNLMNAK